MKEQDSRTWFLEKDFMLGYDYLKNISVTSFLFKYSRDVRFCLLLENMYNNFLNDYLLDATTNGELPIDLILVLVEIDSIVDYMKEKFITIAKIDETILEESAIETLYALLCEPSRFFNLFRRSNK